jgi:hemerythrin
MLYFIVWNEIFSVGNKQIDEQHMQIIDILNQLYVAKQEQSLLTPRHVMDLLLRYTKTHFSYEEDLMRAAGYPGVEAHARYHAWMAGRTRALAKSVIKDEDFLTEEVFEFLKKWWISHTRNADKMYAPYVQKYWDEQGRRGAEK